MRTLLFVLVGIVSVLGTINDCPAQQTKVTVPFTGLPKTELVFEIDGVQADWKLASQSGDGVTYTCDGNKLSMRLERLSIHDVLYVQLDAPAGKTLSVRSYQARFSMPTAGLHAVVCPNARKIAQNKIYAKHVNKWEDAPPIYHCLVPASFRELAFANSDAPFILLSNTEGANALSAGWMRANWATVLSGSSQAGSYVISLLRQNDIPVTGHTLEDALVISTKHELWFDVVRAYAKAFDRFNGRSRKKVLSSWTTEPVFDTWYCYGDNIDQELILKIAKKCKELGFGTLLIDAGWDTPQKGGYIKFEDGYLGDHLPMRDRFPDLAGAIKQMHEMGLRVELWCSPFWQGKLSQAYKQVTGSWHLHTAEGEHHCLCPRHRQLAKYFYDRFAWIAKTYDCDGMWLDSGDNVPAECMAKHEHVDKPMGDAFIDCMLAAGKGFRSVKPDGVIEVRTLHGNLNSKIAFDLIQPSDAPNRLDTQRMSSIHLRSWCHDARVKSDPIKWGEHVHPQGVGRYMATTLFLGVPALSVDFLTASDEHVKITKAWLDFYHKHKDTLLKGEFRPFGATYYNPDMMLIGKDESVVYLCNPNTKDIHLPRELKRVIVFNCTRMDALALNISPCLGKIGTQSYTPFWTVSGQLKQATVNGTLFVSQPVPKGGALIITKN
ncbi:MAG: alpha-amylase family protein [Planctomycetota bacterium]|jgi:alpha-galactosidase